MEPAIGDNNGELIGVDGKIDSGATYVENHSEAKISGIPSDWQDKQYKWDATKEDFVEVVTPPSPQEAYDQIEQLLIDAYENDGAEKPYIDAMRLIDKYPSVERQVERGNYGVAIDYIEDEIMEKEEIVTAEMVDEIKAILNPKEDKS